MSKSIEQLGHSKIISALLLLVNAMTDITISTVYSSLFVWRTPSTLPNITPLYSPV